MPEKQLRGFEKVFLNPGESKTITFTLTPEELYIYNEEKKSYQVPEGEFIVRVGGSSDKLPLEAGFSLGRAEGKADLSVKNIRTMPAFPKAGEEVIFMASLINNGTGPVNSGEKLLVRFYVDGKEVANYHSGMISIPVGGMKLVCAGGLKGKNWIASNGSFKITATVEIAENKDLYSLNNTCLAELNIPDGKVIPAEIAGIIK